MMARKRWTNTVAMAALLGVMSSPAGASGLMTGWFEIEEHLTFASPNSGGSILVIEVCIKKAIISAKKGEARSAGCIREGGEAIA